MCRLAQPEIQLTYYSNQRQHVCNLKKRVCLSADALTEQTAHLSRLFSSKNMKHPVLLKSQSRISLLLTGMTTRLLELKISGPHSPHSTYPHQTPLPVKHKILKAGSALGTLSCAHPCSLVTRPLAPPLLVSPFPGFFTSCFLQYSHILITEDSQISHSRFVGTTRQKRKRTFRPSNATRPSSRGEN